VRLSALGLRDEKQRIRAANGALTLLPRPPLLSAIEAQSKKKPSHTSPPSSPTPAFAPFSDVLLADLERRVQPSREDISPNNPRLHASAPKPLVGRSSGCKNRRSKPSSRLERPDAMPAPAFAASAPLASRSVFALPSTTAVAYPPRKQRARSTALRAAAAFRRQQQQSQPSPPPKDGAQAHAQPAPLASLHELTERIADLLHVGSLGDRSSAGLLCPKDTFAGGAAAGARHHIAVVFGKRLFRDMISVEFAKRVVTLVKQIACGALNPDTICFTGGQSTAVDTPGATVGQQGKSPDHGKVSEATAGYMFFRSVCDEVGLDADRFHYILEEESTNTKENMANVVSAVRKTLGADAVSACHFTLVSSDYHLIRIQEVHRICPRHSLLFALNVSAASWAFIFAAYPFCVSPDPSTAFRGRAMVLANDLSIVLVNLNGVVSDRQFLARENIARLSETFAKMRDMFRVVDPTRALSHGGFGVDMRDYTETLELAIHRVREAHTILIPLDDPCASVSRSDLELAKTLLTQVVHDMRSSLDPDRPLRVSDHYDIVDELAEYVEANGVESAILPLAKSERARAAHLSSRVSSSAGLERASGGANEGSKAMSYGDEDVFSGTDCVNVDRDRPDFANEFVYPPRRTNSSSIAKEQDRAFESRRRGNMRTPRQTPPQMYIARDGPNIVVVGGTSQHDATPQWVAANQPEQKPASSPEPVRAQAAPRTPRRSSINASASSNAAANAVNKTVRPRRQNTATSTAAPSVNDSPTDTAGIPSRAPRKTAPRRRTTLSTSSTAKSKPTVKRVSKAKSKPTPSTDVSQTKP
jgi:DUF218 domain